MRRHQNTTRILSIESILKRILIGTSSNGSPSVGGSFNAVNGCPSNVILNGAPAGIGNGSKTCLQTKIHQEKDSLVITEQK